MSVRPSRARDEGTTLVELLVVMVLTSVVLAAVGTVFVASTRSVRETQVRTSTQADARTAMEAMTRSLRVAVAPPGGSTSGPFVSATPTSVSFYANLQRSAVALSTSGPTTAPVVRASLQLPSLVTYALDTTRGCLTESRTPASVNTGSNATTVPYVWLASATTTKCIARTKTAPSFSYFPSVVIASGPATTGRIALADGTALPAASANSVVSVGIELQVLDPSAPDVAASRTTDRVTLVNVLASKAG